MFFILRNVVNIYFAYQLNAWSGDLNTNFYERKKDILTIG